MLRSGGFEVGALSRPARPLLRAPRPPPFKAQITERALVNRVLVGLEPRVRIQKVVSGEKDDGFSLWPPTAVRRALSLSMSVCAIVTLRPAVFKSIKKIVGRIQIGIVQI